MFAMTTMAESRARVGSRGAVVSAALSERKVAGSIPTIGDFHTVGPCKKAVFACLATDVYVYADPVSQVTSRLSTFSYPFERLIFWASTYASNKP